MANKISIFFKKGFTLVEVLVVLGVTLILSSVLIVYSRASESQIILIREQAKVASSILRAKNLAMHAYNSSATLCGYGVHFDGIGNYIIFRDLANDCSVSDNRYGAGEDFERNKIDQRIRFSQIGVSDVLFIPPDPTVLLDNDSYKDSGEIVLTSLRAGNSVKIKINSAGQVSTE